MSVEAPPVEKPHLTIEQQGDQFARLQSARKRSNQEPSIAVAKLTTRELLDRPKLGTGSGPFQDNVLYDPGTGEIIIPIWDEKNTTIDPDTGNRTIATPEKYAQLTKQNDIDIKSPEDLPKNRKIKVISKSPHRHWDGLEPAIRQTNRILERFKPGDPDQQPQRIRRLILQSDQVVEEIKNEKVSKERLLEIKQNDAKILGSIVSERTRSQTKQEMAFMFDKSTNLDSKNRVNPMISRIRRRSAKLRAQQRLVASELIHNKFSANLAVLVQERQFTRFSLEEAYNELESLTKIAKRLELNPAQVSKDERELVATQINEISLRYLSYPRVAPYLLPARMAAGYLIGIRKEKRELNKKALGKETAKEIFNTPPAKTLLLKDDEESHIEAGRRLRWVKAILREALDLEEHNNLTVSKSKNKKSNIPA